MELLRQGIFFILIGPTGSGKSTFCSRLVNDFYPSIRYAVSATSRLPRLGEVEGQHYFFMSRKEFEQAISNNEFFEWEEIHGNLYGTRKQLLEEGITQGVDLLYQIDIRGALNFKKTFPNNTVVTFIVPPSFDDLKSRLSQRGTVEPAGSSRRFATARDEYRALLNLAEKPGQVDYFLINNEIDTTYQQIQSIVVSERARLHRIDERSIAEYCKVEV